jgi:hypothetical protein
MPMPFRIRTPKKRAGDPTIPRRIPFNAEEPACPFCQHRGHQYTAWNSGTLWMRCGDCFEIFSERRQEIGATYAN